MVKGSRGNRLLNEEELEPWTSGADALNTGEGLLILAPGEAKTVTMTMRLERA